MLSLILWKKISLASELFATLKYRLEFCIVGKLTENSCCGAAEKHSIGDFE